MLILVVTGGCGGGGGAASIGGHDGTGGKGGGGTVDGNPGTGGDATAGTGGDVGTGSGGDVGTGGGLGGASGGNVTVGTGGSAGWGTGGGSVAVGSGGVGSGGSVTIGTGGSVAVGSGGSVAVGSGGSVGAGTGGGSVAVGSGGSVAVGTGGSVTIGTGGSVAVGTGGTVAIGTGGSVGVGTGGSVGAGSGGSVGTGGVGTTGFVITVCAGGGAAFTSIGAAIATAPSQATIQVCPGVYPERLSIVGKSLQIVGTAGAAMTVIDAGGAGTAVTLTGTGAPGLALKGLTIRAGRTAAFGGGIRCEGSVLVLVADIVTGNHADGGGGGLYATACVLDVSSTHFEFNKGFPRGGGALLVTSTGEVRDSQFVSGEAEEGAGLAVVDGTVGLRRNTLETNTAVLRGGGLYHESAGPIADNIIRGNVAGWTGGGVHLVLHAPQFTGNTVSGNASTNDGGGIYIHMGDVTLTNNMISGNRTDDDGAGLRIFSSAVRAEGNVIEDNRAGDSGGGIRVSHVASLFINNVIRRNQATTGGGIDMDNDSSVLRGGEISGNLADRGAGIHATLGPWNGALIEDAVISGNKATWRGGGIALEDNFQPITLQRLTITGNTAAAGGGLFAMSTDFRISNSVLSGNTASANGGAIYVPAPTAWTVACPCPPTQSTGKIEFLTIFGNAAGMGSAVYTADPGALSVRNSILFQNGGTAVRIDAGAPVPVWGYNDTSPESLSGLPSPVGSNGNIALDPLFVGASSGNFRLAPASPAANAGDPGLLNGDGARCDMGSTGGPNASR